MSLSSTLATALTGLTAASRMAEITASNISNALTEGYARREVQLASRVMGQTGIGVTIQRITRQVDMALLQDLRLSRAGQEFHSTAAGFLSRIEAAIGAPDQEGSLSARIATLERSMTEAAARPESDARLTAVLDAAQSLTQGFSEVADRLQSERQAADRKIAADVALVNDTLVSLADLNTRIRAHSAAGRESSALQDQRQSLVDQIAEIIPVQQVTQAHDQISLYSTGGAILLDGRPARLEFAATGFITPDMTLASGALSGLSLNGQPLPVDAGTGRLGQGRLAALFDLRDRLAPEAQSKVDALARDLIERVTSPTVDPTLAIGAAGLFTDAGNVFDPLNEAGLSGRLAVNARVIPEAGGAVWRLRDGIGAATTGLTGSSARLTGLANALSAARSSSSGGLSPGARSLAEFAAEVLSSQSVKRLAAETAASFATARTDGLRSEMLRNGVDSDQEMQTLLLIEKAYAANARVIQTADEMINLLLGM